MFKNSKIVCSSGAQKKESMECGEVENVSGGQVLLGLRTSHSSEKD